MSESFNQPAHEGNEPGAAVPGFAALSHDFDPAYEADVVVEQGDWAQARDGQVIATSGVMTCVAAAIYDSRRGAGYMAHTEGIALGSLEGALAAAVREGGDPAALHIWLTGDAPLTKKFEDYNAESRRVAVEMLTSAGVQNANIEAAWLDQPSQLADLVLDCRTGECSLAVFDMHAPEYDQEGDQ